MPRYLLAFVIALAVANSACGQTPGQDQIALDNAIARSPLFSGAAVVSHDGHITAEQYVGLAGRAENRANGANTLFSIGSIGKMITAYAIDNLVSEGRLSFDDPVVQHLPELDGQLASTLTLDHLLRHRSGLELMEEPSDALLDSLTDNHSHYAAFAALGLRSEGPAAFHYNNLNYNLLGEIIARTTGEPYESYIAQLGEMHPALAAVVFDTDAAVDSNRFAYPYMPVDYETWWNSETSPHGQSAADYVHLAPLNYPSAGGGAYMTARDLAAFIASLDDDGAADRLCAIVQPGERPSYGRGCSYRHAATRTRYGHTGSTAGVQARAFAYPDAGYEIVILSNHDGEAAPLLEALEAELGLTAD